MKRGKMWFVVTMIVAAVAWSGCDKDDDDDDNATVNETDRSFVLMASMSNYAEVSAGQVAAGKAEDPGVAQYGETMVTEHTEAGVELKALATRLGLVARDSLDAEHVLLMDSLETLTGSQFDSVYLRSQIRDHQRAIVLFQNEAQNGRHKDLKTFATDMLPRLEMHLHHADSLSTAN